MESCSEDSIDLGSGAGNESPCERKVTGSFKLNDFSQADEMLPM